MEEHPKVLIQNWHQSAQTQKQVRAEIERVLDADLPESYDRTTFKQKCDNVYDLAVEYAIRARNGRSERSAKRQMTALQDALVGLLNDAHDVVQVFRRL